MKIALGKVGTKAAHLDLDALLRGRLLIQANSGKGKSWLLRQIAEEIQKAELAERSGYSVIGGAFGNPLGALRTKGFLDYPRPGVVKAADWLFL